MYTECIKCTLSVTCTSQEEDVVMAACKMLQHCYGVFQWKPITNFSQHAAPEPRIGLLLINYLIN